MTTPSLRLVVAAAALCATARLPAFQPQTPQPPKGFAKVDHKIRIGVRPGHIRFDKERFQVQPGGKVQLTLVNTDAMQHNLIICRPGKGVTQRVGMAAIALGADGSKRHFVPDSKEVFVATKAILPGEKDVIWFTAPKTPGEYPYVCTLPGHSFTMRGIMTVGKVPIAVPLQELKYAVYAGKWRELPNMETLTPIARGSFPSGVIDLGRIRKSRDYAVRFRGVLSVEKSARYTFKMRSDDGSRLLIDGKEILNLDGVHPMGAGKTATTSLTAGRRLVEIQFFQGGGGAGLDLSYLVPGGTRVVLARHGRSSRPARTLPIPVADKPVVLRVHVKDAGSRSIAVGLPGLLNFVFDADRCAVAFGWAGAFLDVGPDRLGRGGQPCKILGKRFETGGKAFKMQQGDLAPATRFRGYRISGSAPQFMFDWGKHAVTWTIQPAKKGIGLRNVIEIPSLGASEDVDFHMVIPDAEISCPEGEVVPGFGIRTRGKRRIVFTIAPKSLSTESGK